jgi:hypothetical protein
MALEFVIYTSKARLPADHAGRAAAVTAIVASARRHNLANHVSGYLALVGDVFVQIVEGDAIALNGILLRIGFDTRHTGMRIAARAACGERRFSGWSMGCCLDAASIRQACGLAGLRGRESLGQADPQSLLCMLESLSAIAMRNGVELVA